jgi:hypothetical protein
MSITPTVFFSVDVETTSTDPQFGRLLTIGIKPVWWEPDSTDIVKAYLDNEDFYIRIDQTDFYPEWFKTLTDPDSTLSWWLQQSDHAQGEAFRNLSLERHSEFDAAWQIAEFVQRVCGNIPLKNRVFAANPVTFDRAWIDALWTNLKFSHNVTELPAMPFHYRSLCLRSMHFAQNTSNGWDTFGRFNQSSHPHHALLDAVAQAEDLIALLNNGATK